MQTRTLSPTGSRVSQRVCHKTDMERLTRRLTTRSLLQCVQENSPTLNASQELAAIGSATLSLRLHSTWRVAIPTHLISRRLLRLPRRRLPLKLRNFTGRHSAGKFPSQTMQRLL